MPASVCWDNQGAPYSEIFGDKYFCTEDGYAEAVHVGCGGNRLQARFEALDPLSPGVFTIMETGFGTGLDFCCAWELWRACAPASWQLRFISVELYPLAKDQLARALGCWERLSFGMEALLQQYDPLYRNIMSYVFDEGRVHLTVVVGDVVAALQRIKQDGLAGKGADAWFLDGFAPARNPGMWTPEVFAGVAALSRPGTTLSTFTAAGIVRRGLEASGFRVTKAPGHGRKKHILTGIFAGSKVL